MNDPIKPYAPINRGQMALDIDVFSDDEKDHLTLFGDDEIFDEDFDDLADEYADELRLDNRDRARDQNAVK